MSLSSFFGNSREVPQHEFAEFEKIVAEYRLFVAEERTYSRSGLVKDLEATLDRKRIIQMAHVRSTIRDFIDYFRSRGYEVLTLRCLYYTAAVGDSYWTREPHNRTTIKLDFLNLKRIKPLEYQKLRGMYRASFTEFWYIKKYKDGSFLLPTDFLGSPDVIFSD